MIPTLSPQGTLYGSWCVLSDNYWQQHLQTAQLGTTTARLCVYTTWYCHSKLMVAVLKPISKNANQISFMLSLSDNKLARWLLERLLLNGWHSPKTVRFWRFPWVMSRFLKSQSSRGAPVQEYIPLVVTMKKETISYCYCQEYPWYRKRMAEDTWRKSIENSRKNENRCKTFYRNTKNDKTQ